MQSKTFEPRYKRARPAGSVLSEQSLTEKKAAATALATGSLVRHQTLGLGKVIAREATALHVFFPARDSRFAAKLRWPSAMPFLSQDGLDPDPWLEGLTSFAMDSAMGRYALAASFISQDEAIAAYLAEHPTAFQASPSPRADTPRLGRAARWREACAQWTALLGNRQAAKLAGDGKYAELARRALRVAACAAPISGMVETEVLEDALEPGEEVGRYFDALVSYLSVPSPARPRFERLCAATNALGVPPEAAWPLVTFFPFVAVPSRHMILVPRSSSAGASRLGCDLQQRAAPNWATYTRLRDLSTRLLEKLGPSGARDLVDVECFLHATGARRPLNSARRAKASDAISSRKKSIEGAQAKARGKR